MGVVGARGLAQLQAWRARSLSLFLSLSLSVSPTHTPHDTHNTDTNKKTGTYIHKHTKGAEWGSAALAQRKDIEPGI